MAEEEKSYEEYVGEKSLEQVEEESQGNMTLIRHLEELRHRLIYSFIAIAIGTSICYFFIEEIMHYLTLPAGKLYYMQPAEAFFTYLKVSIFTGFLVSLPVVLYHVWRFFLPALTAGERVLISIVVPVSAGLFYIGMLFSFFFVLPAGIKFFLGFGSADLQPLLSVGKYLDFVISFVLPFGVIFELPLVIVILAKMGIINSAFLRKKRRIVIFMTFVLGAIISPTPDVFSQSMIAVPMILLYEISVFIVRFILRK